MEDNRREQIKEFVEREMIGPDPIDWEGLRQENGEEILVSDPPRIRYIAGILFPQNSKSIHNQDEEEVQDNSVEDTDDLPVEDKPDNAVKSAGIEYLDDAEELINRSNAYNQSAMSLTISVDPSAQISVSVKAGVYEKKADKEDGKTKYYRRQITHKFENISPLPDAKVGIKNWKVPESDLQVDVTYRYKRELGIIYTFTLENTKKVAGEKFGDDDCCFQAGMEIETSTGFIPLPAETRINADDDYLSNQLLYRDVKNYAIGHGCAADWKEENGQVLKIATAIFPEYEVKPIVPSSFKDISLSMYEMSQGDKKKTATESLNKLCDEYETWILGLEKEAKTLDSKYLSAASRHITNCKNCLSRMRNGVTLLSTNETVVRAFMWMNRAMLLQQIHYGLPLQKWEDDGDGGIKLDRAVDKLPEIDDSSTWYKADSRVYGQWRPFQIAFILMNLESMYKKDSMERGIVDLIWFPTGGGKTEAYLGLSAYTIFIRRLLDKDNAGTAIIMRYTLRLLTAQQYERASAMICACEVIRRENEANLGSEEISIGLWVGADTTPNTTKDAVSDFNDLYSHKSENNPFVMLKCPWCGAQMGPVDISGGKVRIMAGYRVLVGARKTKKFVFQCSNDECAFSKTESNLPLYIVDEDIYEKKPTLLLGTVDKFAMLPFRPQAQGLFGYEKGVKKTSPDLIIQDELHLISGPLGSMVGHYETMINELCADYSSGTRKLPKIIASTATISRAKEQCRALYGCDKERVFQFPPAGLNAGDSFFAKEDANKNGRKYIGILADGSSSDATTAIRLFSILLYAAKTMKVENERDRDPYWTNIGYYNSIRELGQAQTWIKADIEKQLDVLYKRRFDDKRLEKEEYRRYRRYIVRDEELTSRISGNKVTASLANLNIEYPPKTDQNGKVIDNPIDICLATNMISVGLDVQRLGLMTVAGQPKSTSEYIQATSRVGRDANNAPGEIFVLYRPGRPRDKSYYEQFRLYHSRLYCNVEPTSVTPFSSPIRDRALHAIIIGILRLEQGEDYNEDPPKYPDESMRNRIKGIIRERIEAIDSDELENTLKYVDYIFECWEDWNPQKWSPQINPDMSMGDAVPLMYSSMNQPNAAWLDRGKETPTSMRSVDASCEAKVLLNRYVEREE